MYFNLKFYDDFGDPVKEYNIKASSMEKATDWAKEDMTKRNLSWYDCEIESLDVVELD